MIYIKNLRKSFGDFVAIDDISMTFQDGGIIGLIGHSGSGKSTLLRCINGLIPYDSGSIEVAGKDVHDMTARQFREFRRKIGMIFQNFALVKRLDVYDNIALPMRCWNYSKQEINSRVLELLEMMNILDKKNSMPSELSGGQKQRVAIARALTMEPDILLCDEATSALDPNTANNIMDLIKNINEELGITIIVVTHQLSILRRYCKEVFLMDNGKVVGQGDVVDFFLNPPPSLIRLMGEQDEFLMPQEGKVLMLLQPLEQSNIPIVSKLALKLGVEVNVLLMQKEEYLEGDIFKIVIQVSDDSFERVKEFLDSMEITWVLK